MKKLARAARLSLAVAIAASTVPAQVRKSFAVMSVPVISLRYAFTSADVTLTGCPAPTVA